MKTINFLNSEDLHNKLYTLINGNNDLDKITFKNDIDKWEYSFSDGKIIEEQPRGIQVWQSHFVAKVDNYIYANMIIQHKDRYVKTKDQLIIKDIEKVEIY